MANVFIGGSRHISRLNGEVTRRLDTIVQKHFSVLVGDANGADRAVQSFLRQKHYANVLIYCSGTSCRNNVGQWRQVSVAVRPGSRGLSFYMAKDAKMAQDSDYGFMLWDGKSAGTINNVLNLLSQNKQTLVYFSPHNEFITIASVADLERLLSHCNESDISKIDRKIGLFRTIEALQAPVQTSLEISFDSTRHAEARQR